MATPVTIRVLGPLEIERADGTVAAPGHVQARLLAALVVADGRTVSVESLVDALWGEAPPRSARNSLQSHVARLRDLLGDHDVIVTRPPGYAIDPRSVRTDAADFDDAVRAARPRVETDPDDAAAALTRALELWRGEAFAGLADEVTRHDATRLEDLRATARRLLATAHRRRGDLDTALRIRRALHAEDPLREADATQLAAELVAAGRIPDALEVLRGHRRALRDELGLDPGHAVAALEQQLLAEPSGPVDRAPPPDRARRTPRSYGRDPDRVRLEEALRRSDLVTVVGPGGVGKTHLAALTVGRGDGARWVDLADVRSPDHLAAAVIDALGVLPGDGRPPLAAATEALARSRGTVVIDNCEHLIDDVADLVDRVANHGGSARLLATSREPLEVPGERVVRLDPLPVPSPDVATGEDPAVALFTDRLAAAGGPSVAAADAARVVAAVGGLPLAIELAAARAVSLPLPALLGELRTHLAVLAKRRVRPGDRHGSLAEVITWSHDLLPDLDQVLFRRLAVFAASFRVEDAARVCAFAPLTPATTTTALAGLVERSMVARTADDRYRLLEPLRLDARARLTGSGELATVEDRQREQVLELAARARRGIGRDGDEAGILAEVRAALPDVRAVHARAHAAGDVATAARLVTGLYRAAYWQAIHDVLLWAAPLVDLPSGTLPLDDVHELTAIATSGAWMAGRLVEARELAARLHDVEVTDPDAGIVVAEALGDLGLGTGHLAEALTAYERATEHAQRTGADGLQAQTAAGVALTHAFLGDHERAFGGATTAAELAERAGAPIARALCSYVLGEVLAETRPDEALEHLERAVGIADRVGADLLTIIATTAEVALRGRHGDPGSALARYAEVLPRLHEAGADGFVLTAVRNLVVLLVRTGRDLAGLELAAAVDRVAATAPYGPESARLAAAIRAAEQRLRPDEVRVARDGGRAIGSATELADAAIRATVTAASA